VNPSIMYLIGEAFPSTKWTETSNRRYVEAFDILKQVDDDALIRAVRALRNTLARNHISPEELVLAARKLNKPKMLPRQSDEADRLAAIAEIEEMRRQLVNEPAEDVRAAVTMCRSAGVLDNQPLPANRSEWRAYPIGVVSAALQRIRNGGDNDGVNAAPPKGRGLGASPEDWND